MTCKICQTSPVWKFTNKQQLCSGCFVRYFEKKVLYTIRKYQMPISIIKKTDLNSKIINNIIKNLPKRTGKLSSENLDDISLGILNEMMNRDSKNLNRFLPKNQPLYFLSDKEIELYAKIKKISGKTKKLAAKEKKINDFIIKIEQKNPDIRQNIVNALTSYLSAQ
jgi:hypothetical protein